MLHYFTSLSHINLKIILTLTGPITTAADDILKYLAYLFFKEKKVVMKHQNLFSLNNTKSSLSSGKHDMFRHIFSQKYKM